VQPAAFRNTSLPVNPHSSTEFGLADIVIAGAELFTACLRLAPDLDVGEPSAARHTLAACGVRLAAHSLPTHASQSHVAPIEDNYAPAQVGFFARCLVYFTPLCQ
jgi:hypothetical protein